MMVLRDLCYCVPEFGEAVSARPNPIRLLFKSLRIPGLFPAALALLEELLCSRKQVFDLVHELGPDVRVRDLVLGFSPQELAMFTRLVALLVFEPEDRVHGGAPANGSAEHGGGTSGSDAHDNAHARPQQPVANASGIHSLAFLKRPVKDDDGRPRLGEPSSSGSRSRSSSASSHSSSLVEPTRMTSGAAAALARISNEEIANANQALLLDIPEFVFRLVHLVNLGSEVRAGGRIATALLSLDQRAQDAFVDHVRRAGHIDLAQDFQRHSANTGLHSFYPSPWSTLSTPCFNRARTWSPGQHSTLMPRARPIGTRTALARTLGASPSPQPAGGTRRSATVMCATSGLWWLPQHARALVLCKPQFVVCAST